MSVPLFVILGIVTPKSGHEFDTYCWRLWAEYIFDNGLSNIYRSGYTNYLPLMHYLLRLFDCFQSGKEAITKNIFYLKYVVLFFHFVTGWFIVSLIKKDNPNKAIFSVLFYLLNIAVLYNTIIWGQVDDILTCLMFVSAYFAYRKNVLFSVSFLVLALNFKLQAIIFLPFIILLLLPVVFTNFSAKNAVKWIVLPSLLQFLIVLPFIANGTFGLLYEVIVGSVEKYPVVSMNAFNVWEFLLSGDLMKQQDSNTFAGITYKRWGLLMFFVTSGIALFPLMKNAWISIINKVEIRPQKAVFLIVGALIPLLFFYFNTQMHERYSHPAFAFLIAYAILSKKPLVGIVGSLAYLLNMECVYMYLQLPNYHTLIFEPKFISSLYLFTIVLLYIDLFGITKTLMEYLCPQTV